MIIGSGPIVIGQACEFDYSGTQACKALKSLGYQIVLVNSNPATIMTDPNMADATYIEPLNLETMTKIIEKERPDALLPNLGGQTGLNLSSSLVGFLSPDLYCALEARNRNEAFYVLSPFPFYTIKASVSLEMVIQDDVGVSKIALGNSNSGDQHG